MCNIRGETQNNNKISIEHFLPKLFFSPQYQILKAFFPVKKYTDFLQPSFHISACTLFPEQEIQNIFSVLFHTCRFGVPAAWQPGDVALVCNYRWAHGRPQVELRPGEERKIGVMIGAPIQRVGQKEGKW